MGIETGQQTDLSLIPERGSRIRPADTYMRPTVAPVNEGYKGMMDALGGLSDKLNNYSQEQQKVDDKNGIDTAQTTVAAIQKEYGTSTVSDTQAGLLMPQASQIVQHNVNGILGTQAAREDIEPLLTQWNSVKDDPDKSADFIQDMRDNTNDKASGNVGLFWKNNYKTAMDGYADKLEDNRQGNIAKFMDDVQQKDYNTQQRDSAIAHANSPNPGPVVSVQGITGSYQGENQECASLTKALAPDVGHASEWKQGEAVQGNTTLAAGTPIATFNFDGKYGPPSAAGGKSGVSHTGIYMGQDKDGVKILDQFNGSGGAKVRVIPWADWNGNTQEAGNKFYAIAGAKPVNLPSTDAGHSPDDNSGRSANYGPKVMGVEGGTNPTQNPNSSAKYYGQFIDSNAQRLYDKLGLTGPIASYANQRAMVEGYADENTPLLKDKGVPVNDTTLRLAHFLGPQGAINLLKAPAGTKASDVLSEDAIKNNMSVLGNGKTVDQVKQWSAKQMNGSTDPNVAAQNDARGIDQTLSRPASLGEFRRRESYAKTVIEDLKAGDQSTYNAFPPDWKDSATQHAFDQAKEVGDKMLASQEQTKRTLAAQRDADESKAVMQGILKKAADPTYIPSTADILNPRTGAVDKAAQDYQQTLITRNAIPPANSTYVKNSLIQKIKVASSTGNWKELMPELQGGTQPTPDQINKMILDRKDLSSNDQSYMMDRTEKYQQAYTLLRSPVIDKEYNQSVAPAVQAALGSIIGKIDGKMGARISVNVRDAFNAELHKQWDSSMEGPTGLPPTGPALPIAFKAATDAAKERLDVELNMQKNPPANIQPKPVMGPDGKPVMGNDGKPKMTFDNPSSTPPPPTEKEAATNDSSVALKNMRQAVKDGDNEAWQKHYEEHSAAVTKLQAQHKAEQQELREHLTTLFGYNQFAQSHKAKEEISPNIPKTD